MAIVLERFMRAACWWAPSKAESFIMLKYRLLHPELLAALARSGHGSGSWWPTRIIRTHRRAAQRRARVPEPGAGLVSASDVLKVILDAIRSKRLRDADGRRAAGPGGDRVRSVAARRGYQGWRALTTMRQPNRRNIVVIATGEQRQYANYCWWLAL